MNPFGPFGNMMPYSNFHGMNLDWVIQIAKDFLDQYTSIQQVITEGEESLENHCGPGCGFSPDACDQGRSDDGLSKGKCGPETFGGKSHEANMEKLKILLHYKSCTDRIQYLKYS